MNGKRLYYWEREPGRLYTLAELRTEAEEAGFYWDFDDIITGSLEAGELRIKEEDIMDRTFLEELRAELRARRDRSAWGRGVVIYALELCDNLEELEPAEFMSWPAVKKALLNGATDWAEYSYSASSLIYDRDICERLCTPSERRRYRDGERDPRPGITWIDEQARALRWAQNRIEEAYRTITARQEVRQWHLSL